MKRHRLPARGFGSTQPLAIPYMVWLAVFTLAPLVLVIFYAFTRTGTGGVLLLTGENLVEAFQPIYMRIFGKSVLFAVVATAVCLLLGYPAAYILSKMRPRTATLLSVLFVLPMWMNFLLRTYAWRNLLDNSGLINQFLGLFGLGPFQFLYTDAAIVFGLVYNFLPFMILPIYSVLQKLDPAYALAAQDLGANRWQTFFKVTVPLTKGGIVSGITMVFMPAMTTFVITRLLGGSHVMLYGDLIEMEFLLMSEWNFGSALAVIMMILTILFMWILRRYDKEGEGAGLI